MIILAGTPIGNLGDASARLSQVLRDASLIACEDTRVTARLLNLLGIRGHARLIALHEHNEDELAARLAERARDEDIVLVSDAGMPGISDPGYPVVAAARAAGVPVTSVPGPSAVVTALAISGLHADRFAFEGFVPRKRGERARLLEALADEPRTTVLFESPHRLAATLREAELAWPGQPARRIAVCRELTKLHEEVRLGTPGELAGWAQEGVRGEIVLVIEGAAPAPAGPGELAAAAGRVRALVADGERRKEAASRVAAETGLPRRELYEASLRDAGQRASGDAADPGDTGRSR